MTVIEQEQQIEILRLRAWLDEIKRAACFGSNDIESMVWDALGKPATKLTQPHEFAKLGLWPDRTEYAEA